MIGTDDGEEPGLNLEAIEPLVDARTIAKLTGMPLQTIWRACRDGILPHYRLARTVRFDPVEVLERIRRDSTVGDCAIPPDREESATDPDPGLRIDDVEWWRDS